MTSLSLYASPRSEITCHLHYFHMAFGFWLTYYYSHGKTKPYSIHIFTFSMGSLSTTSISTNALSMTLMLVYSSVDTSIVDVYIMDTFFVYSVVDNTFSIDAFFLDNFSLNISIVKFLL